VLRRPIEFTQYLSIRYSERLEEEKAVASVGSRGDSHDNALAETINGLYRSELIYNEHYGPWRTVEDVELASLGWVHWWNFERLLEPIGYVPPAEFEAAWHEQIDSGSLGLPESPALETGGTGHPGNETLDEHRLAGVSS
jgi:putative transposase